MMLKWWNLMPFILVSAGFLQCTRDHVRVYFLRTKLTKENQMVGMVTQMQLHEAGTIVTIGR